MSLGNNNKSKAIFKDFVSSNSTVYSFLNRHSNVMIDRVTGEKVGFALYSGNIPSCRQFYTDCAAVIFYNNDDGNTFKVGRDKLYHSQHPTRITSSGFPTYNAKIMTEYIDEFINIA